VLSRIAARFAKGPLLSNGGADIRLRKIIALEQQRQVCRGRQRVGKAVANIQPRLMPAFAEPPISIDGVQRHPRRDGGKLNAGKGQKFVNQGCAHFAVPKTPRTSLSRRAAA